MWKMRAFAGRAQGTEVHLYTVILFRYKTPGSIETNVSKLSGMFFFRSDLCCISRGAGGGGGPPFGAGIFSFFFFFES